MHITIFQYNYVSVVKNFTIFAPLKHGTRWLNITHPISIKSLHHTNNDKGISISPIQSLSNILFSDKESPFQNSKIKLKKFKKEIIIENPVFVYRDPYDTFVNAILTGTHNLNKNTNGHQTKWDGDPQKLNIIMTNNGHFSPVIWQEVWQLLELLDDEEITFVNLRELSDYIMINTLQYYPYNFNSYTFQNSIVNNFTKDEVIQMCKEYHPTLWDNFMLQIEKETIALNKLLEKFKWNGK